MSATPGLPPIARAGQDDGRDGSRLREPTSTTVLPIPPPDRSSNLGEFVADWVVAIRVHPPGDRPFRLDETRGSRLRRDDVLIVWLISPRAAAPGAP